MIKNITLKNLRPKLPGIIADVDSKMDRFIITKRGKPVAMIISVDDYDSMLETLDILSNAGLMKKIKKAKAEVKKGNTKALDIVERELGII